MRNIKRSVTVLISAIREEIGWHPSHVRNKGFCLTSKDLCRRKCLTALWQEHACPLSTTVAWWCFVRCDEYSVKEVAFKKKGAKTDRIYFGIECILLYAYIMSSSLYPAPSNLPSNFFVTLTYPGSHSALLSFVTITWQQAKQPT